MDRIKRISEMISAIRCSVCSILCIFNVLKCREFLQFLILNDILQLRVMFFWPCLRRILRNMASISNSSQRHKVSHFDWNFLCVCFKQAWRVWRAHTCFARWTVAVVSCIVVVVVVVVG